MSLKPITPNGCWCWFQNPRALCCKDKIFVGWVTNAGAVQACEIDLKTLTVQYTTTLATLEADDHNAPTILELPDGRLVFFYTRHSADQLMRWRRTKNPYDIRELETERTFTDAGNVCYSHPFLLREEGNKILLFYRGGSTAAPYHIRVAESLNLAESFGNFKSVLVGSVFFPYPVFSSDGKKRIDFGITGEHPRFATGSHSIYYCYYENGRIYRADGSLIKSYADLPLTFSELEHPASLVYDWTKTNRPAWIWDVCSKNGKPYLVFATFAGTEDAVDHRYYYAFWDETWVVKYVCHGGGCISPSPPTGVHHYSGGIFLDHFDPRTVVLARKVNGIFRVEKWTTNDGGDTWEIKTIAEGFRPITASLELLSIFFLNGTYLSYTSYNTAVNGYFEPRLAEMPILAEKRVIAIAAIIISILVVIIVYVKRKEIIRLLARMRRRLR